MRKEVFVLVFVLLLVPLDIGYLTELEFVSAHEIFLDGDNGILLSYQEEREIDNPNRYPIEAYKYGYTYRATNDFKRKFGDFVKHDWVKFKKGRDWDGKYWEKGRWNKDYYYKWSVRKDCYEKIVCYHSAPRGKFFYRKCP